MVYVDELKTHPDAPVPFHRGSCHLTADTLEELHLFASNIGMRRTWFQNKPGYPHYDLTPSKREQALNLGATFKTALQQARERRAAQKLEPVIETPDVFHEPVLPLDLTLELPPKLKTFEKGRRPQKPPMPPMPALSQELTMPRSPDICQACGKMGNLDSLRENEELQAWRECDEKDKPTATVIVLCRKCADKIIEPHPRLYEYLPRFQPRPGSMPTCIECPHRKELVCRHPDLKANGGDGLALKFKPPSVGHVLYRTGNGRRGGWMRLFHSTVYCTALPPSRLTVESADCQNAEVLQT